MKREMSGHRHIARASEVEQLIAQKVRSAGSVLVHLQESGEHFTGNYTSSPGRAHTGYIFTALLYCKDRKRLKCSCSIKVRLTCEGFWDIWKVGHHVHGALYHKESKSANDLDLYLEEKIKCFEFASRTSLRLTRNAFAPSLRPLLPRLSYSVGAPIARSMLQYRSPHAAASHTFLPRPFLPLELVRYPISVLSSREVFDSRVQMRPALHPVSLHEIQVEQPLETQE